MHLKTRSKLCCQAKAKQLSTAGLTGPDPSIRLASQVAEDKARKKAESKTAEKDRKRKRDEEKRETKRLQAETERAALEVSRQANLAALRLAAEHTPELLNEICEQDTECRDAACNKWHHCTRNGRQCPRLL